MTLFKTVIAAANVLSAMYERSVFSYRGINLRNRLNQECANSTTHRRALNEGFFSINCFSSPRGRMWGMNPLDSTVSSLPTYAASRQRFCGVPSFSGAITLLFSKESRETLSCRLAPLTTSDKGAPFSSTSKCRFVPFFSPIRWVGADRFLRKRCLNVRPVGRLPEPGDTFHGIVFSQPALPYATKHPRSGPLLKFSMNHRRADSFKFLSWQGVPNDTCPQDVHYCGEEESVRVLWFSATARLTGIFFSSFARICGDQRFNDPPECVRNFPGFDACHFCLRWLVFSGIRANGAKIASNLFVDKCLSRLLQLFRDRNLIPWQKNITPVRNSVLSIAGVNSWR